jgi:hypothetical protein
MLLFLIKTVSHMLITFSQCRPKTKRAKRQVGRNNRSSQRNDGLKKFSSRALNMSNITHGQQSMEFHPVRWFLLKAGTKMSGRNFGRHRERSWKKQIQWAKKVGLLSGTKRDLYTQIRSSGENQRKYHQPTPLDQTQTSMNIVKTKHRPVFVLVDVGGWLHLGWAEVPHPDVFQRLDQCLRGFIIQAVHVGESPL